eukprot:TRINITY_DN334_c0_g1_i3.p1 TRINITY_DN334_c0_g1~~TRINITY_DN334_c0_g1_i3.p1  ORF type:complete len:427 (+),score=116.43 TRINITY_DN334_c0_g1_i3:139-1419(+)
MAKRVLSNTFSAAFRYSSKSPQHGAFRTFAGAVLISQPFSTISVQKPAVEVETITAAAAAASYVLAGNPSRTNWCREEIQAIYDSPLMDIIFHAGSVHRAMHRVREVQQCTLLSIKTGGCQEDCSYCPQSSRYHTPVKAQRMLDFDSVMEAARKAKEGGSTRFCMGAAWRDLNGRNSNFKQILQYVQAIRGLGMEVCCTLGMLSEEHAKQLKAAGLTAYNHNLDSSREFYPSIISTRTYDERLQTLQHVRDAGISVCCGGIIGMGESPADRVGLLHTLSTLPEHPESVPINALVAVEGTPLAGQGKVEVWEMLRMIGTARIIMPKAMVRLSAGRVEMTMPEQALCFLAGANSVFVGEKLLTTPNNMESMDEIMFKALGLLPKAAKLNDNQEGDGNEGQEAEEESWRLTRKQGEPNIGQEAIVGASV